MEPCAFGARLYIETRKAWGVGSKKLIVYDDQRSTAHITIKIILLDGPVTSPFLTLRGELCRISLNLHRYSARIWGREFVDFEQETFSSELSPWANAKIYILWGAKWVSEVCRLRRLENCQKPGKVTSSSFCNYCGTT